jgi:hypothetical protein
MRVLLRLFGQALVKTLWHYAANASALQWRWWAAEL